MTKSGQALRVVLTGHVDNGKSTLAGRLAYDFGLVPADRQRKVRELSGRVGKDFELAFLLDAFEEEQSQERTIEASQVRVKAGARDYVLIDTPGHKEFLKSMVTGASGADAAILVMGAQASPGRDSPRHDYLLGLLGVRKIVVAVNKMDAAGYERKAFESAARRCAAELKSAGLRAQFIIPVSAAKGDNILGKSARMPWYSGPTLTQALGRLKGEPEADQPLRLPVQDVYEKGGVPVVVGRVEAGRLLRGQPVVFQPSGRRCRVNTIEKWNLDPGPNEATAGESIGVTLAEPYVPQRGEIICSEDRPPRRSRSLGVTLFWMGREALRLGRDYRLKLSTQETACRVSAIDYVLDTSTLKRAKARQVEGGCVAQATLETEKPLCFDDYSAVKELGRLVILDGLDISGGGIVAAPTPEARAL